MDDERQQRDELVASLAMIDAIRAGQGCPRKPDEPSPLMASRLAILDAVEPLAGEPTRRPHLRVIQGGKAD